MGGYLSETDGGSAVAGAISLYTGLPARGPSRPSAFRVYPRAYGATSVLALAQKKMKGLSSCIRGYHAEDALADLALRSIPVHTGLPYRTRSGRGRTGVYPRVYGATDMANQGVEATQGLSPRVRGYRLSHPGTLLCFGSIPVYTELPRSGTWARSGAWVHPRAYGVTVFPPMPRKSVLGLSPCIRGLNEYEMSME